MSLHETYSTDVSYLQNKLSDSLASFARTEAILVPAIFEIQLQHIKSLFIHSAAHTCLNGKYIKSVIVPVNVPAQKMQCTC